MPPPTRQRRRQSIYSGPGNKKMLAVIGILAFLLAIAIAVLIIVITLKNSSSSSDPTATTQGSTTEASGSSPHENTTQASILAPTAAATTNHSMRDNTTKREAGVFLEKASVYFAPWQTTLLRAEASDGDKVAIFGPREKDGTVTGIYGIKLNSPLGENNIRFNDRGLFNYVQKGKVSLMFEWINNTSVHVRLLYQPKNESVNTYSSGLFSTRMDVAKFSEYLGAVRIAVPRKEEERTKRFAVDLDCDTRNKLGVLVQKCGIQYNHAFVTGSITVDRADGHNHEVIGLPWPDIRSCKSTSASNVPYNENNLPNFYIPVPPKKYSLPSEETKKAVCGNIQTVVAQICKVTQHSRQQREHGFCTAMSYALQKDYPSVSDIFETAFSTCMSITRNLITTCKMLSLRDRKTRRMALNKFCKAAGTAEEEHDIPVTNINVQTFFPWGEIMNKGPVVLGERSTNSACIACRNGNPVTISGIGPPELLELNVSTSMAPKWWPDGTRMRKDVYLNIQHTCAKTFQVDILKNYSSYPWEPCTSDCNIHYSGGEWVNSLKGIKKSSYNVCTSKPNIPCPAEVSVRLIGDDGKGFTSKTLRIYK